jgi:hypothetical protein
VRVLDTPTAGDAESDGDALPDAVTLAVSDGVAEYVPVSDGDSDSDGVGENVAVRLRVLDGVAVSDGVGDGDGDGDTFMIE